MGDGPKADGRRRTAIWVGGAALIVFAGTAAFMHLGASPADREQLDIYSSLSPAPDGTKAIYTLLGDLGFRTRRALAGFDEIEWDETDVLVSVQPVAPVTDEEHEALTGWVEEGGTVLLAGQMMRGGLFASPSFDLDDPFVFHTPPGPGQAGRTRAPEEWLQAHSELKDRLLAGVDRFEYKHIFSDRLGKVEVDIEEPAWRKGPHEVLVGQEMSFVEVTSVGDGRVVKVLDENILLNRSIRLGRNLVFVLNVLEEYGGRGRVVFDEAHRSLRPGDQPSVWEVLGPASEVSFLQLLLAVLAGVVALGWRPAPALPERRERRRRALQQVEALAGMMERAGAARLAVRLIHRRTRHLWETGRLTPGPGPRSIDRTASQARLFKRMDGLARRIESMPRAGRAELVRYIGLFRQLKQGKASR